LGSRSLQRSKVRKSTFAGLPGPLRSALRVCLPSRRLTPSEPVPVLFHTGGALGIRPSELPPPGRYPERFRPEGPTYRSTHRCSRRRSGGPAQRARGFWALALSRVPDGRRGVSAPTAGYSLGLHPSRAFRRQPGPGFHPDSSHALRSGSLSTAATGASECQSVAAWSRPPPGKPFGRTRQPF
jgi:hypothetical protein